MRLALNKSNKTDFVSKYHQNINVFSSDGNYVSIKDLYLSDRFSNDFQLEKIVKLPNIFISKLYCDKPKEYSLWNSFFMELGISSQKQFIERISNYITPENVIEITSYIYDIWERDDIKINFSDLMILNKNNKFVSPSSLYLNDHLNDKIFLENDLDNHKFLNEKYFSLKEKKKNFVKFLIFLGVKNKPEIIEHLNSLEYKPLKQIFLNQSKLMKAYIRCEVLKNADFVNEENKNKLFNLNIKIKNLNWIDFIERCIDNYNYSKSFWTCLINNYKLQYRNILEKAEITFLYKNTNYTIYISSFLEYLCKNTNILPTSFGICLSSDKIYSILNLDVMVESIKEEIPFLNLNFPNDLLNVIDLKNQFDVKSILRILSNLNKKNLNIQEIIYVVEFCYTDLLKDTNKLAKSQIDLKLFSLYNTFENSKNLFYFKPNSVSFDIIKNIGNLIPFYLPEKLKNHINLNEFLKFLDINIIEIDIVDVEHENLASTPFDWLETKFRGILPFFAEIIYKNKDVKKKFSSIEEIILLGKSIQFLKVSKLVIKYKEIPLLEPLTYRKKNFQRNSILCKVLKINEQSLAKMTCGSFICKEIINTLEISEEFFPDLFSLLCLDGDSLCEFINQKKMY